MRLAVMRVLRAVRILVLASRAPLLLLVLRAMRAVTVRVMRPAVLFVPRVRIVRTHRPGRSNVARAVTVWVMPLTALFAPRVRIVRRRRLRRCYVPRAVTVRAMRLAVQPVLRAVRILALAAPATLLASSAMRAVTV